MTLTGVLAGKEIPGLLFSLTQKKCCSTPFWPPWLRMGKLPSFELSAVWAKCYFSLADVKIFLFVFDFQKLDYMCLRLHLFAFVTLEVMSFAKFGKFSAIIF